MGSNPNTGFDLHSLLSSLSSVQFKIGYALGKSPHVLHPVSQKFPQRCLLVNNDRRTDQGPVTSCRGCPLRVRWTTCLVLRVRSAHSVLCFTSLHTFQIPRKRDNVFDCEHSSYQKTEQADGTREIIPSSLLRGAHCSVWLWRMLGRWLEG